MSCARFIQSAFSQRAVAAWLCFVCFSNAYVRRLRFFLSFREHLSNIIIINCIQTSLLWDTNKCGRKYGQMWVCSNMSNMCKRRCLLEWNVSTMSASFGSFLLLFPHMYVVRCVYRQLREKMCVKQREKITQHNRPMRGWQKLHTNSNTSRG